MANYELETKLNPSEVLERAEDFFGEKGLGLAQRIDGPAARTWQGGGGAVFLAVHAMEKGSRVELATTEWDAPVREFMSRLPKKGLPFL
jgi:hypothetical protein